MAEIILIRHGQASFGADNYDRLSALGRQQSILLGQHLKDYGQRFDRLICGTMVRHAETADGILQGLGQPVPIESTALLNEYRFQSLLSQLKAQYPTRWVDTGDARRDYYQNIKLALTYWMQGAIQTDGKDSWRSFRQRVREGFSFASGPGARRTLLVSSGGPIAVILASVLGLDDKRLRNLTLQVKNTSASRLLYSRSNSASAASAPSLPGTSTSTSPRILPAVSPDRFTLDGFNDVGHLLSVEQPHNVTFA
ncbi:histidine phosphatase family protein [Microbulbifer agarilyticus]|uniref:histidine phosphatase family protein n=1 Tax=Microbulbifer agarilyticus TaxID=260552 RepID=UPI001CD57B40|nr:histidine phosphatase family protein [Microbulbifer agarilyticus]MCA0900535.1 histidine phosphatase family protein [Microbulbifer agarilyticus]